MSCFIFDKLPIEDTLVIENGLLQSGPGMSYIRSQLRANNDTLWRPIFINSSSSVGFNRSNLLIQAKENTSQDPCNCVPVDSKFEDDLFLNSINCDYCSDASLVANTWNLTDDKQYNTLCEGKDIRANKDDLLPKIPVLDSSYITNETATDLKYAKEYPARQKGFLGFENFYSNNRLSTFRTGKVNIDWRIAPTMGEIPFDNKSTYHKDIDTHLRSYKKFVRTAQTCGNFIRLNTAWNSSSSALSVLPKEEDFTVPYGLSYPSISNVFVNSRKKKLSHWLWDLNSGVLCWYRHNPYRTPTQRQLDQRPFRNYDIYIAKGDVFWANIGLLESNAGSCPWGVKVTDGYNKIIKVIGNNGLDPTTPFLYISVNLYRKFLKILYRLETYNSYYMSRPVLERISAAAVLASGPSFDEITIDSFKTISLSIKQKNTITNRLFLNINDIVQSNLTSSQTQSLLVDLNTQINNTRDRLNSIQNLTASIQNNSQSDDIVAKLSSKNYIDLAKLGFGDGLPTKNVSMEYIDSTKNFINTIAEKYGSYFVVDRNGLITKNRYPGNFVYNVDCDIYTNVSKPFDRNVVCSNNLNNYIGLDYIYYHNNEPILSSILDNSNIYSATCQSGVLINQIYAATSSLRFSANRRTVNKKVVSAGNESIRAPHKNFKHIYYRGSYDFAVLLEDLGEALCFKEYICDNQRYIKYRAQLPNSVSPLNFLNNDINLSRNYSSVVYNPALNIVGIKNNSLGKGVYFESSLFGKETHFDLSTPPGDISGDIRLDIITFNSNVKIYNLKIEKLRDLNNPKCKTFPNDTRCLCYPTVSINEFPYSCSSSTTLANTNTWVPDVSTRGVVVSGVSALIGYQDPLYPGCYSEHSISLPVHTRTSWRLFASNFNLPDHDLWVKIDDSYELLKDKDKSSDISRKKIVVDINGQRFFPNQWRKLNNLSPVLNIELIDPKYAAAMGRQPSPTLYKPLKCSSEILSNFTSEYKKTFVMQDVSLNFAYVPHKHKLYYKHNLPLQDGILSRGEALREPSPTLGYKYIYDKELNLFRLIRGSEATLNVFQADITNSIIEKLGQLNKYKNKKINLHVFTNSKWYTVDNFVFGYYIGDVAYAGTPIFFERIHNSSSQQLLSGFLPRFRITEPELITSVVMPTYEFYKDSTFKLININHLLPYFSVNRSGSLYNYDKSHNLQLPLDRLNSITAFNTLIDEESMESGTRPSLTILNPLNNIRRTIAINSKYIFRSKTDDSFYTSFGVVQDINTIQPDFTRIILGSNIHITRNQPLWKDVINYDYRFKSFDISNKLSTIYETPKLLTYDQIFYDLLMWNTVNRKTIKGYVNSQENIPLLRKEKDFLEPSLSLFNIPTGLVKTDILAIKDDHSFNFRSNQQINELRNQQKAITNNKLQIFLSANVYESGSLSPKLLKLTDSIEKSILFKNETIKSQKPAYLLERIISNRILYGGNATRIFFPTMNLYNDNRLRNSTSYTSNIYDNSSYPIYALNNREQGCSNPCTFGSIGDHNISAVINVANLQTTSPSIPTSNMPFFISLGEEGNFINGVQVERIKLDPESYNALYPGRNPTNQLINNGFVSFIDNEDEYFTFGKLNNLPNITRPVDTMVNKIFTQALSGSFDINLDTINSKTILDSNNAQNLSNIISITESSKDVLAADLYKLIPYEYDTTVPVTNKLKINGSINIDAAYRVGESVNVTINNRVFALNITEDADSIKLMVDSDTIILHTKRTIDEGVIAQPSGTPAPPDSVLLRQCTTYYPQSWFPGYYFASAEFVENGKSISLIGEYQACVALKRWGETNNTSLGGCSTIPSLAYDRCKATTNCNPCVKDFPESPRCSKDECAECAGRVLEQMQHAIAFSPGCGRTPDGCPAPEPNVCNDFNSLLPANTTIAVSNSFQVTPGGRSVYPAGACIGCSVQNGDCSHSPRIGFPSLSPVLRRGDVDQFAGGWAFRTPVVGSYLCEWSGCGSNLCTSVNYTNKFGQSIYTNFLVGGGNVVFPPGIPCECNYYTMTDCSFPTCNPCDTRTTRNFSYSFEFGNHNLTFDASLFRDNSTNRPVARQSLPTSSLSDALNCSLSDWSGPVDNDGKRIPWARGSATEVCYFASTPSTTIVYDIYKIGMINIVPWSAPLCPINLVTINYDNNFVRFIANGQEICKPINITSCPNINITVPSRTRYLYSDSISSECSECGSKDSARKITIDSNRQPDYEFIIENRIGILGIFANGGDINYTVVGGSAGWTERRCCGGSPQFFCGDGGYVSFGGFRQCGKSAPDSYIWQYCLSCDIPGSANPSVNSSYGGNNLTSYVYGGLIDNCRPFVYTYYSSPQINSIANNEWRRVMELKFRDVNPCFNNQNIDTNNLVEGILPGSCQLRFGNISYPGLAYRRTFTGITSQSWSLGVSVAYVSYRYKRPKTLDDVYIDNPACGFYNLGNSPIDLVRQNPNMLEKYVAGGSCNQGIQCVEDNKNICDDNNYCCRTQIKHTNEFIQ